VSRIVGAFACPRGVFGVEVRRRSTGLEVLRSFDAHGRIESAQEAVGHLARMLASNGIKRAEIALAVRGFGAMHHVLAFPRASDAVLGMIVDREVRRLESEMADPATGWTRLAPDVAVGSEPAQVDVLAAAIPRDVAAEFSDAIQAAGHKLSHLTVLTAAMHRLAEEFVPPADTSALVAQLPDGPFLGYAMSGALRLAIEPPVRPEDVLPDAAALAEEVELGSVFVRQQFRGATMTRACVIASDEGYPEIESVLGARINVPIERVPLPGLSPGGVAAFGALLDGRSQQPVTLAGRTSERGANEPAPGLQLAATAVLVVAAILGVWTIGEALLARSAAARLADARRQIDLESSRFIPARETADRRKLIRDAAAVLLVAERDRSTLQSTLATIASSVPSAVRLDSLRLERGPSGWLATLGGSVSGTTSGAAVQSLSSFYRDLPRLVAVESLALRQLAYADATDVQMVHFEIGFGVRTRTRD
jgi:hypothetical protein